MRDEMTKGSERGPSGRGREARVEDERTCRVEQVFPQRSRPENRAALTRERLRQGDRDDDAVGALAVEEAAGPGEPLAARTRDTEAVRLVEGARRDGFVTVLLAESIAPIADAFARLLAASGPAS